MDFFNFYNEKMTHASNETPEVNLFKADPEPTPEAKTPAQEADDRAALVAALKKELLDELKAELDGTKQAQTPAQAPENEGGGGDGV